jgi:hypothetical protein
VPRDSIKELEAEVRYQRERFDLYRQKAYGPRPTSETRMRELERLLKSAESRLAAARASARQLDS